MSLPSELPPATKMYPLATHAEQLNLGVVNAAGQWTQTLFTGS